MKMSADMAMALREAAGEPRATLMVSLDLMIDEDVAGPTAAMISRHSPGMMRTRAGRAMIVAEIAESLDRLLDGEETPWSIDDERGREMRATMERAKASTKIEELDR